MHMASTPHGNYKYSRTNKFVNGNWYDCIIRIQYSIKSIITIAAVAVTGLILASIIGSLIKKFDLLHLHIPMPWNKGKVSRNIYRNIYPL